jgi:hypothetical protein
VAFAAHHFAEVAQGFSQFLHAQLHTSEILQIAWRFACTGQYDVNRIGELKYRELFSSMDVLYFEQYSPWFWESGMFLLSCVASLGATDRSPELRSDLAEEVERFLVSTGNTAEYRHSTEIDTADVLEPLVSKLGMVFADLQCWRQGVSFGDGVIPMDYHDQLQEPYYAFSQAVYQAARQVRVEDLNEKTFAAYRLDWRLAHPLPEDILRRCTDKPPPHE